MTTDDGWRWALTVQRRAVTYGGLMALELLKRGATFSVTDDQVVPGGDPETSYVVRVLTRDDVQRLTERITAECTEKKFDEDLGRMVPTVDRPKAAAELGLAFLDHAIVSWIGWVDEQGEALPCDLSIKRQLPMERQDRLVTLAKDNARRRTAALKESFREPADAR